jgi:hypothetical protein
MKQPGDCEVNRAISPTSGITWNRYAIRRIAQRLYLDGQPLKEIWQLPIVQQQPHTMPSIS